MNIELFLIILATFIPAVELRGSIPLGMIYASNNGIPFLPIFLLIIFANITLIFIVLYFLDEIHCILNNFKAYNKISTKYLGKFRKKVDKFERHHEKFGYLALTLFVSIPVPGTGVWSGSLISWILGLERKKSILFMSLGVIISGLIVFFGLLGLKGIFS